MSLGLFALVEGFGPISATELAYHSGKKESECSEYLESMSKHNMCMLHCNFPKRYKVNPYYAAWRTDADVGISYAAWRKTVYRPLAA